MWPDWSLSTQVNILESKNHLSQLIRRAQEGEEVIFAHLGVPAVK